MAGDESGADERGLFESFRPEPQIPRVPPAPVANADKGRRSAPANRPDHHGHRERLRERFRRNGSEALPDYELLELLLFRMLPRRDTKPIARELLRRFGSIAGVVGAPPARLSEVDGIGDMAAQDIKVVAALAQRMLKGEMTERPLLGSWKAVIDYCRAAMAYEEREQFRILFVDKKNRLIADEVQQTGTVDHAPVYPREVARRALELAATAVVLVHNHPSGDPTPSRADVQMTRQIMETLAPLSIAVHDHIVIGREGHASLRGLQLI